ncbi:NEP1-interacting protein-like 1 [Gossypium arboreum]|uniref:NEP1-interacting protein-like 1 n=1 Tax=Gossypium arboreum TaxID=29729 RepID=UPI0022F19451|nr:NEP1-interacting protein-like 1 [Gossypium arboreum]
MEQPICPCPFIMPYFPAEEARELCCSAASLVISKLFHAIFIFIFSVVGATLGAMVGAFVGAKTKIGWLHGASVGAIRGSFFSIKLFEFSLIVCSSDDMATSYFFQPV